MNLVCVCIYIYMRKGFFIQRFGVFQKYLLIRNNLNNKIFCTQIYFKTFWTVGSRIGKLFSLVEKLDGNATDTNFTANPTDEKRAKQQSGHFLSF